MKQYLLIGLLGLFVVGCATVKEQVSDDQKILIDCTDKGTSSVMDGECQDAAKKEGGKVKDMVK